MQEQLFKELMRGSFALQNLDMGTILPLAALATPQDITTTPLKRITFGSHRGRLADTGILKLFLGRVLTDMASAPKLSPITLIRACLERYNTACLELALPLSGLMDQGYLAQAVSVGCNLYETIRLLARSGEISSDANNTYFRDSRLGFQPYHWNEESNEEMKRLVIALGLRTVEFLFQAGIVTFTEI